MTNAPISNSIQRLHQLAWQPGTWMHDDWWKKLDLSTWQESYRRYPACRASIDQLITKRRAFPRTALPGTLNAQQEAILKLEPRFTRLITALGIVALNCPDFLIMRPYREALARHLGNNACDQLLVLHSTWQTSSNGVSADALAATAFIEGVRWWQRDTHTCPVCTAFGALLPPQEQAPLSDQGNASSWLVKIGRFI